MVNEIIKTALLLFSQLYMNVPPGVVQMPLSNCCVFICNVLHVGHLHIQVGEFLLSASKKFFSEFACLDKFERIIHKVQIREVSVYSKFFFKVLL